MEQQANYPSRFDHHARQAHAKRAVAEHVQHILNTSDHRSGHRISMSRQLQQAPAEGVTLTDADREYIAHLITEQRLSPQEALAKALTSREGAAGEGLQEQGNPEEVAQAAWDEAQQQAVPPQKPVDDFRGTRGHRGLGAIRNLVSKECDRTGALR